SEPCEIISGLMKRREKNRVAAQKSRKRQTQRADQLHEVSVHRRNLGLYRVDSLSEEQRLLSEALQSHEPFCPMTNCCFSSASSCLQQDNMAALSH
uniref:BZIP domain-containing protein n=1 Tax=Neogobius melanostomus TaxID=47308 RepID=A0A8C6TUA5_9GOBI